MYEKYLELKEKSGLTDYRVCSETGVSTATMSNWKKYYETGGKEGYQPKMDKIISIAKFFGVTVDYFLK